MITLTEETLDAFYVQVLIRDKEYKQLRKDFELEAKRYAGSNWEDINVPVTFAEAVSVRQAIKYGFRLALNYTRIADQTVLDAKILDLLNQRYDVNQISELIGESTLYIEQSIKRIKRLKEM